MKVISWNASMKFREKFKVLDERYHAYILFKNVKIRRGAIMRLRLTRTLLKIIYGSAKIRIKAWVYLHVQERNLKRLNFDSHYLRYMPPFKFEGKMFFGIWAYMRYVEDLVVYFSIYRDYLKRNQW